MTRRTPLTLAVTALLISALAGTVGAQGRGRGRGQDKPKTQPAPKTESVTVVFRDTDRATFRDYFVTHKIAPQALPPGIAMNVARGKRLPPGIAKRAVPADLVVLLPRHDPSVTFYIVGDRVVALRSGLVIDVLINIFR